MTFIGGKNQTEHIELSKRKTEKGGREGMDQVADHQLKKRKEKEAIEKNGQLYYP